MATLNFPNTLGQPTDGSFTYIENNVIYSWNGTYWSANNATDLDNRYVNANGDTMTGDLTVPNLESAGDIQSTSQNGGQLAGFRNQIINGDFRVWQRGTTNAYTGVAPNQYSDFYLADRWHVSLSSTAGVNGTASQTSFATVGIPGAVWGINFAQPGAVGIGMTQMIEVEPATYGQFAAGSQWTISWWTDNPNVVPYVTWASEIIDATGTEFTETAKTALETIGSFTRYTSTITVSVAPRSTDSGLRVVLADFGAAPASFSITAVQLEPGAVATPFEHRPIATETALCQRYYWTTKTGSGNAFLMFNVTSDPAAALYCLQTYPTSMRVVPTLSYDSFTNANVATLASSSTTEYMYFSVSPNSVTAQTFLTNPKFDAEL